MSHFGDAGFVRSSAPGVRVLLAGYHGVRRSLDDADPFDCDLLENMRVCGYSFRKSAGGLPEHRMGVGAGECLGGLPGRRVYHELTVSCALVQLRPDKAP